MADCSRQSSRHVLLIAGALLLVYLLTANYSNPYGTDAFTNAAQARAFADDQDPILEELDGKEQAEFRGGLGWFTESPNGTTSQYPPGAAVWGALFYLSNPSYQTVTLNRVEPAPGRALSVEVAVPVTYVPAAVAATLSVALAIGFLGLTVSSTFTKRETAVTMLVGGLGTGAWSVAADEIWQHGPAMMCISIGTYLASRDRFASSGLAFAAAIIVRPHVALITACIGLVTAYSRRSLREVAVMGAVASLGLWGLLLYNNAVYGSYSISGGYGDVFTQRLASESHFTVLVRLVQSLFHPDVGLVWTSSFLLLSLAALWGGLRTCPDWSIGAALGGFIYLVVQYRANRVTGGGGFFSYRYPLEALMAAGPMMAMSTRNMIKESRSRRRLFSVLAILSVLTHGAGAILV